MESKTLLNLAPNISNVDVKTNFDFKLEGWSASITLISFCMAGVLIYAIGAWEKYIEYKNS